MALNLKKYLEKTNIPAQLLPVAMSVLEDARGRAKWLNARKWWVRLVKSKGIAKKLSWESERLVDVDPSRMAEDIAPSLSVTCYGDHIDWNPATNMPEAGTWLNQDPESDDYKLAVAATKEAGYLGVHPRSFEFHRWWYRRNGGEGLAWMRGMPVDMPNRPTEYNGKDVRLLCSGDAWQLIAFKPLIGSFGLRISLGYEIANVWNFDKDAQGHYSLPGYELRAPLTWSILPGKRKKGGQDV